MTFDSADFSNGVSIQNGSEITIDNAGVYNIQFSAQIDKTDSGPDEIYIWLSKNGSNVLSSNTKLEVNGNNAELVAAWNWLVQANDGDYYEIYWSSTDLAMRLLASAGQSGPTRPAIPSIILTVSQVTYTQIGPTGPTGGTGPIGPTGSAGISPTTINSFGITIDGQGGTITTGTKGYVSIPYNCTVSGWTLISNATGSIVIDIWKRAGAVPTVADAIAGTGPDKPTLSSQQYNTDTSLATWSTTGISANDVIGFNVDSSTTVASVSLTIAVTKT